MILFLILFILFSYEFLFFFFFFIFLIMNNYSWLGLFIKIENRIWFVLVILCFFLLIFLNWTEKNINLLIIGNTLIFFSILFFFRSNFIFLYIFFEFTLFPIIIIILIYGRQIEKINSGFYLVIYTLIFRFRWLIIFFYLGQDLILNFLMLILTWELFLFFSLLFLVKFPIYFFHLWLPKAHVEAPTRARILLAALLLKLGTAGLYRILKIFNFNNLLIWILIRFFGIICGTVNCFFQRDSKSFLAYSSIIHINFLFFILLILNNYVKRSSILMIISHGFISSLIFFFIGEFYKFSRTRFIFYFKNLLLSSLFFLYLVIFCILGNRAVPLRISFFLEFIGIFSGYEYFIYRIIFLGFYFFFRFYASFFLLITGLTGKKIIFYRNLNLVYFYFFNLIVYFFLFFIFFSVFILKKI